MIDRSSHDAGSPTKRRGRKQDLGLVMACLVLSGLVAATPVAVQASEDDRSGFSIFFEAAPHIIVQRAKGSSSTNFGVGSDKENLLSNMTFRLGGGGKGPAFEPIWGKPRPVIWAAALLPLNESSTIGTDFVEELVAGVERLEFSKYAVEYQTSALAGLGLEFVVPVFDYEFTIMPGIESLHMGARYTGSAVLETQSGLVNQSAGLSGKKQVTQHYVGPILRVGTPTFEFYGVIVDFSIDLSVLFDVAGTRKEFAVRNQAGDSAEFSFEAGSGVVQIGLGIQLRWP